MKKLLFRGLVLAAALLVSGYMIYDNYFQLPQPPQQAEENTEAEEKNDFDKFNVLILGLDGRVGVNDRTDTILLASLDGDSKQARVISIPRDTRVKVKGCWDKVNAAYVYGGPELTMKTVSDLLEIRIDRYVIVDFQSLIKIVDELGGIEVDVPQRMYVPLENIDLQPGKQHLDGEQVLAYSRFRGTSEGDIGRVKRQQEVIGLLAEKIMSTNSLASLPGLLEVLKQNVDTDMTTREIIAMARLAPEVMEKGIAGEVLPGKNKKIDGIWYWEPEMSDIKTLLVSIKDKNKEVF